MIYEFCEMIIFTKKGFYRYKCFVNNLPIGLQKRFHLFIYYYYLKLNSSYISHQAHFTDEPCFPHGVKSIFIAGGSKIGKNAVIFQNVTIGSNPLPFSKTTGSPAIGNNCYIGAGANIIGDISIGDNCRIGANTTVFADVPDNTLVLNHSPRLQQKKELINKYYKYSYNGPIYFRNGKWHVEKDPDILESLKDKL